MSVQQEVSVHPVTRPSAGQLEGYVFDIQGHSVHDGPGTRTTVFMSGCPLRCKWCCNPEGLATHPQLLYIERKCQHCLRCKESCPHDAISVDDRGALHFDRNKCLLCETHDCIANCYNEAIRLSAKTYTVDELMRILRRDRAFWSSDGGVTLSGGEPLMQKRFAREVLRRCQKAYIHTAIETTAYMNTDYFLDALDDVDWLFTDIKHMDPERHKEGTGVDNRIILENIAKLLMSSWPGRAIVRIPIIPGFNDDRKNLLATSEFVRGIGLEEINILPFHRLGETKYEQLGRTYAFAGRGSPSDEHMTELQQLIQTTGLQCYVGYKTPF